MKSIVGVFENLSAARRAAGSLTNVGISSQAITVLAPGSSEAEWNRLPTAGTEQPGMGEAVGGMVGGAIGVAAGAPIGAALASLMLPGVGPVVAAGIAVAAVLGTGGVVAGVAAGKSLENHIFTGLPEDEIYFYEDALRHGHSLVIAFTGDEDRMDAARRVLEQSGAESLNAARESWWLGIRSAEKEHYESHSEDFQQDERSYRNGFEAALRPAMRGLAYEDALESLRRHYPDAVQAAFRRGYERGQTHLDRAVFRSGHH
jgi:hypothetical protein